MDRRTLFFLTLGKYGGYLAVLWVVVSFSGMVMQTSLVPFFFVFAIDSIRTYYLDEKFKVLCIPSLYLQLILALVFIFLDGSPVGAILLIILSAESIITYSRPYGDYIFLSSLIGFPLVSAASLYWRSSFNWNSMASVFINCLFLFFAYAVSYMARRQLDEKERAEDALEQLNRSRSDLEKAYHKLIEVSKEREQLAADQERTRMARELHDTLAHTLTAVVVSLEAGKKLMSKNPEKALAEISKSQEQARRGLEEVRNTVKTLRSGDLETMDLSAAIKSLARDYAGSGIVIEYEHDDTLKLNSNLETNLYRIIQESITNSVRHGQANMITVKLNESEEGLLLEIEDNGKGCSEVVEGYGLRGIRERASELGGRVVFQNSSKGGFLVSLRLKEILE